MRAIATAARWIRPSKPLASWLNGFKLDPRAYDRRHGSLAREYRIVVTSQVVFSNAETGEVIHENPVVIGDSEFAFNADLTSSKREGMPAAAADLARKVVSLTVNGW